MAKATTNSISQILSEFDKNNMEQCDFKYELFIIAIYILRKLSSLMRSLFPPNMFLFYLFIQIELTLYMAIYNSSSTKPSYVDWVEKSETQKIML